MRGKGDRIAVLSIIKRALLSVRRGIFKRLKADLGNSERTIITKCKSDGL